MRYSGLKVLTEGLFGNKGWTRAWREPEPKAEYDVVIIGGGGHGLATAYYLAKEFKQARIAVLEKGYLGGGNVGRNTTIIRSNYLQDPSAAIYEKARSLYETLSQDLNYNVMFSPRGVMMLAQTHHEVRGYLRTVHANNLQGVSTEWISPAKVKELVPIINIDGPRYPVLGALYQPRGGTARHDAVAWGYARACSAMGMDIIQQTEVTAVRSEGGVVKGVETSKGFIGCNKLGVVVAGHSGQLAEMAGFRLPVESLALQALVTESQRNVSGTVRVKLYKGGIYVTGRKSTHSLYNPHIATMEADPTKAYNQDDASGFIRLNGLRLRVGAQVNGPESMTDPA